MSAVLANQLKYLLARRQRAFRPLQWRSFIPIQTAIPTWATSVEIIKLDQTAQEPVPHQSGNQKAPTPSYSQAAGTLSLFEFALAYQVFNVELDRAAQVGINVPAVKTIANQRSAEEFLDNVASLGKYNMPSMLRSADVPVVTLVGNWESLADDEVLKDFSDLVFSVKDKTKGLHQANQVILPDTTYKMLAERDSGNTTLLRKIQDAYPGVRISEWYKARLAGGSLDTTRAVALDSSSEVLEMLLPSELKDGEPLKIHGGYEVLQTLKTGGVMIHTPDAIAYGDGV